MVTYVHDPRLVDLGDVASVWQVLALAGAPDDLVDGGDREPDDLGEVLLHALGVFEMPIRIMVSTCWMKGGSNR